MHITVIYNSRSGSAPQKKRLAALFEKHDIIVDRWIRVEKVSKRTARSIKPRTVVAVIGGDGTISSAVNILAETNAILAPLPGGTLNHFTKDLGIDQDIERAIAHLKKARKRTVDVGVVNGRVFVNNSSIGLYPTSLRVRNRFEQYVGKWPSAVYAVISAMIRLRLFTVTVDGTTFKTPFVFVGNNIYTIDAVGGVGRTRLDGGKLSVFIAKTTSRLQLLKIALFTFLGAARYINEFDVYELETITIHMKRHHVNVSYDGEVSKFSSPLTYSIRRKALSVLY